MIKYNIHVNGTVVDESTGFEVGIDISVTNGGSIEHIGKTLQTAVDSLKSSAVVEPKASNHA